MRRPECRGAVRADRLLRLGSATSSPTRALGATLLREAAAAPAARLMPSPSALRGSSERVNGRVQCRSRDAGGLRGLGNARGRVSRNVGKDGPAIRTPRCRSPPSSWRSCSHRTSATRAAAGSVVLCQHLASCRQLFVFAYQRLKVRKPCIALAHHSCSRTEAHRSPVRVEVHQLRSWARLQRPEQRDLQGPVRGVVRIECLLSRTRGAVPCPSSHYECVATNLNQMRSSTFPRIAVTCSRIIGCRILMPSGVPLLDHAG